MHVLLLGNGFDLHYNFPTRYHNFLHVVEFIVNNNIDAFKTIGDILGDERLHTVDKNIKDCYELYKDEYDSVLFDSEKIIEIRELAKDNYWFRYFLKSLNKNIGWIDFEREIGVVLECFQQGILNTAHVYQGDLKYPFSKYILQEFGFWIDLDRYNRSAAKTTFYATDGYLIEYPAGSGAKVINKDKIIKCLFESLQELSKILRLYMFCFVESPLDAIKVAGKCQVISQTFSAAYAITLNYTNTYERLYNCNAQHLHGNVENKIILGINPNSDDNIETVDVSFIPFKKYFQRVLYGTDIDYIEKINELKASKQNINLTVFGHSLDETDKDVIKELFSLAKDIGIFYYKSSSMAGHMSNLIKIFGLDEFNKLRTEKNLRFIHTSNKDEVIRYEKHVHELEHPTFISAISLR